MDGAARVFAGEFNRSTLSIPGSGKNGQPVLITPGGALCREVFLAGALLEVAGPEGDFVRARVADPTGAFALSAGRLQSGAMKTLRDIAPPAFVTVLGTARISTGRGKVFVSVIPEEVRVTDRNVRDTWVLRTADHTIRRIEKVRQALAGKETGSDMKTLLDHYRHTEQDLQGLAGIVETALASVRPVCTETSGSGKAREIILGIICSESGPRGIAVDDLLAKAGGQGISPDSALEVVRALLEEDECYQPQKGTIKLL